MKTGDWHFTMEEETGDGDGSCLFVGVSTGEVDGDGSGLAGKSSIIALSLSAPVDAATALKVW